MTNTPSHDEPAVGLRGLMILVVEDSSETMFTLRRLFQGNGAFQVELCASVRKALHRLHDASRPLPDVAVIDYNLVGEQTGLDLALAMRTDPRLRDIKRVSYSSEDLVWRTRGMDAGGEPVYHLIVPKPQKSVILMQQMAALFKIQHLDDLVRRLADIV